ncbi:STYKc [Musa troglodytarum]|uniref:STYKc n=1 Tax=Musa troglodytarum TaxID=320322 RepID=A0A9E7K455_9LILI|nr:STYKc [Musa troglodytarum]
MAPRPSPFGKLDVAEHRKTSSIHHGNRPLSRFKVPNLKSFGIMASAVLAVTGQIANVAQLAGLDAVRLIVLIVEAAAKARILKKNCRELADYLRLIGDLLEPLDMSDLKTYPETRAALEELENVLKKAYILVNICQKRSFLYLMAMGWMLEHRFQKVEADIERYLRIMPLVNLVDVQRARKANLQMGSLPSETPGFRVENEFLGIFRRSNRLHVEKPASSGIGVEVEAGPDLRTFQLSQLKLATRNFSHGNIVGEAEFAVVYKGRMDDQFVAVKRWELNTDQGLPEWVTEMKVLRKLSHPNLVRLLGYCKEENALHLVYEFMPNGSLQHHLLEKGKPLSWRRRIKIAIGAARCLRFLHKSDKCIVHRDVKPSVILLDSDFNAKLSGLGWSSAGLTRRRRRVSRHVVGTPGYMDPRCITTGHLDAKTDVYAFGMVLLQMLTGRKVFDPDRPRAERDLAQFAKPHLSADGEELASLMDPKLNGAYPPAAASQLARITEACIETEHKLRPTMNDVVKALEKIDAIRIGD